MGTKKLDEGQQRAVVRWFAECRSPSQVAALVLENFGITITRGAVQYYNPTSVIGAQLPHELAALFWTLRGEYFAAVDSIPIANQAVRLRRLEDLYQREVDRGNLEAAARRLEDAAKEIGGLYTNRREVTGRDGEPFGVVRVPAELPPEQWAAEVERQRARKGDS